MIGTTQAPETQTNASAATTRHVLPRLRLRQRSNDHPMAMFAIIVTAAFVSMALMPSTQSAFASTGFAPQKVADSVRTTEKTGRLPATTETAQACEGQAWGDESLDCLLVIARENGQDRAIRMIADADPDRAAPNVF